MIDGFDAKNLWLLWSRRAILTLRAESPLLFVKCSLLMLSAMGSLLSAYRILVIMLFMTFLAVPRILLVFDWCSA